MPRPICIKCQVEFRCKKNGFRAVLMAQNPPEPYQVWDADMWECPRCGTQILCGFGQKALAEHWQENFAHYLKELNPKVEVFEKVPSHA